MAWDNVKPANSNTSSEVEYFKPQEGIQVIRILDDEPYSRFVHWIPSANNGKGVSIDCIGAGCPVCEEIARQKASGIKQPTFNRRMVHSINICVKQIGTEKQETLKAVVLEKGNNVFVPIKDTMGFLAMQGLETDLTKVDLYITVTGKDKPVYSVQPLIPTFGTDCVITNEKYNCKELKPALNREQILGLMNGKSLDDVVNTTETQEETTERPDVLEFE